MSTTKKGKATVETITEGSGKGVEEATPKQGGKQSNKNNAGGKKDKKKKPKRPINPLERPYIPETPENLENLAEQSDSTDDEGDKNRIGNVPLEWYKDYDHIGYDVSGKRIIRKERGDALDQFLASQDPTKAGRTIYDPLNDETITLSDKEIDMLHRIRHGKFPDAEFDPYKDYTGDFATAEKRVEMFGNAQRPKAAFIPSKWEAKKIVRYVHAIRNGWLKTPEERAAEKAAPTVYLLWDGDGEAEMKKGMPPALPAPKVLPPGHAESYNPPREYLPSEEEIKKWEDMDPEDRPHNFIPKGHDSLMEVGSYPDILKERFERCLDLYLCPRMRRKKMNVDPESLVPKLPKPQDLRPFPTTCALEYTGHADKIRSFSLSPNGEWLASGSDDCTLRVWETNSGRCFKVWRFTEVVESVAWNPNPAFPLIAVITGSKVLIVLWCPGEEEEVTERIKVLLDKAPGLAAQLPSGGEKETKTKKLDAVWTYRDQPGAAVSDASFPEIVVDAAEDGKSNNNKGGKKKTNSAEERPATDSEFAEKLARLKEMSLEELGVSDTIQRGIRSDCILSIELNKLAKVITWHHQGDYFATSSPDGSSTSVAVHRLSHCKSQAPFSKSKGLVQTVSFHPTKPFFILASQRHVRIYNLAKQQLVKTLQCPARWISTLAVHPTGDHILLGSYDRRVCWYDLDLSTRPYKTLKYHARAIRSVGFHATYPLFATASDDGNVHVFHATVYTDLLTNPLLVPVKILNAHSPVDDLGVMDLKFHPSQPWLITAGADHKLKLFM